MVTRPVRCFIFGCISVSIVWAILFLYVADIQLDATWKQLKLPTGLGSQDGRRHVRLQPRDRKLDGPRRKNDQNKPVVNMDEYVRGGNGDAKDDSPEKIAGRLEDRRKQTMDLNELGMVQSTDDEELKTTGNRLYAFNLLISDRLGNVRNLPDVRSPQCNQKVYPGSLPSASIVICFYNEAWSVLLRTVYSVIDLSPAHLVHEIILIDDNSDLDHLKTPLDDYVKERFSKVRLFHTTERHGLIRARIYGAAQATGSVLVFLDSHCEVNVQWLPPLLSRIKESRKNVVIPIIDIISSETFEYKASPLVRGGFNWGLHFRWDPLPPELKLTAKNVDPIKTPTMAGGLFAMDRNYFNELGQYDSGMDIWGGENLEISFRIWQCGGNLEIIPCSRVGHVFRHRRPYGAPKGEDTMTKNSLRLAHVWMDEYKEEFFKTRPSVRDVAYGDIAERVALRERLKCKSFKWYMQQVYPEQTLPDSKGRAPAVIGGQFDHRKGPQILRKGKLKHMESGLCVEPTGEVYEKKSTLKLARCEELSKRQMWYETDEHELLLSATLCLDIDTLGGKDGRPRLMKCHGSKGSQEWSWSIQAGDQHLYNAGTGKCLSVIGLTSGSKVTMSMCDQSPGLAFQMTK